MHYNCEIGMIPPEDDVKQWLSFLKTTWETSYTNTKLGIIDTFKNKFFSKF